MMERYRVMKRGGKYQIELQDEPGSWTVVGECDTLDGAKELLKDVKGW